MSLLSNTNLMKICIIAAGFSASLYAADQYKSQYTDSKVKHNHISPSRIEVSLEKDSQTDSLESIMTIGEDKYHLTYDKDSVAQLTPYTAK